MTDTPRALLPLEPSYDTQSTGLLAHDVPTLRVAHRLLQKAPFAFDDCIAFARRKFQKYFSNDSKQLLHVYPLEAVTKDGSPFWALPKRPPHALVFDAEDPLHIQFIIAASYLRAAEFCIPTPPRNPVHIANIMAQARSIKLPVFVPSEEKARLISAQVVKAKLNGSTLPSAEDTPPEDTPPEDTPPEDTPPEDNILSVNQEDTGDVISAGEIVSLRIV